jgi:hypothetical protein
MDGLALPLKQSVSANSVAFEIDNTFDTPIIEPTPVGAISGVSALGYGVSGTTTNGLAGVFGSCFGTGFGVKGESSGGSGVWAQGSPAGHFESSKGYCVEAVGTADVDAINATTSSPHHAALAGHNNGGGFGLWAKGKTAGHFETDGSPGATALEAFGLVNVNGTLTANPAPGANAIMAFAASGAIAITATASAGNKAISALGDVEVRGNHTVTGNVTAADVVLGGSDCAEDFDIATLAAVEPGTVMVFTDTGPWNRVRTPTTKRWRG